MKRYIRSSIKSPQSVRLTFKYKGTNFRVYSSDVSDYQDPESLFNNFKADITEVHPYDLAEYAWARLADGVVKYYMNGKLIDRTYYFNADDMDVENYEWADVVVYGACDHLIQLNKRVNPRIDHT